MVDAVMDRRTRSIVHTIGNERLRMDAAVMAVAVADDQGIVIDTVVDVDTACWVVGYYCHCYTSSVVVAAAVVADNFRLD